MNIWIVIAYDPLPGIDLTTRTLRYGLLAEQLVAAGHSVVFWTSTFDHWRKLQRAKCDTTVQVGPNFTVEMLYAPAYRNNISWARIRHNRSLAAAFTRRAADYAATPDVVVAGIPCLELAAAAVQTGRSRRAVVIADVQDIWPEVYVSILPHSIRPLGRLLLGAEFARARGIFRQATAVTAVSGQYLEWAKKVSCSTLTTAEVFHLGYRMPSLELQAEAKSVRAHFAAKYHLPENRPLALFLGQFAASYDVATLARAAALLLRTNTPVHVVMAGDGERMALVHRLTAGLPNVTITGWLEYRDTLALLSLAHIGVAAYARTAAQSLPYKPFEYMAFDLPLISSLTGELQQLIATHDIGKTYQAGDPHSLAKSIATLAGNPTLREATGQRAGKLFRQEFDARVIYSKFVDYIERLAHPTI